MCNEGHDGVLTCHPEERMLIYEEGRQFQVKSKTEKCRVNQLGKNICEAQSHVVSACHFSAFTFSFLAFSTFTFF
jgi:hypothetical protein